MSAAMSAMENATEDHGSRSTLLFHATSSARKESVAAASMHAASRRAHESRRIDTFAASIRRAMGPRRSGVRPHMPAVQTRLTMALADPESVAQSSTKPWPHQ